MLDVQYMVLLFFVPEVKRRDFELYFKIEQNRQVASSGQVAKDTKNKHVKKKRVGIFDVWTKQ